MVIFKDDNDALATERVIRAAQRDLRVKVEFKFNKVADSVRDGFFHAISACRFQVRAIVVEKTKMRSESLKTHKERFYSYFVRQMMTWDDGLLVDAKVRIDGSGDRAFKRELAAYLRRFVSAGKVRSVEFSESRRDPLIQLSDMVAGAIGRSYRIDKADPWRWRRMLQSRLEDVWNFG
jgi:hypothetical protein